MAIGQAPGAPLTPPATGVIDQAAANPNEQELVDEFAADLAGEVRKQVPAPRNEIELINAIGKVARQNLSRFGDGVAAWQHSGTFHFHADVVTAFLLAQAQRDRTHS